MYISVIPLAKSLSRFPYIYSVSEVWQDQIVEGGLVEIPFGTSIVEGLIISHETPGGGTMSEEKEKVKPIVRVIVARELLDRVSLFLILSLAKRYFLPIHKVALIFLPRSILSALEKKNYLIPDGQERSLEKSGNFQIYHALDENISSKHILGLLEHASVVVFPDTILMDQFYRSLPEGLRDRIEKVSGGGTPKKKRDDWINIRAGKYDIIFGTRRILYYNLTHYRYIIYLEDAFGSEQFHYPIRIRSLDILASLRDTDSKNITLLTSSPTLLMLSLFRETKIIPLR